LCRVKRQRLGAFGRISALIALLFFLLPPEMITFYKNNIDFITEHAVDPDKRRYASPDEAPRHYIDLDHYCTLPCNEVPMRWDSAVAKFSEDTLKAYGIVPWHLQFMMYRLTNAFRERDKMKILRLSADIGHYIGDANVPAAHHPKIIMDSSPTNTAFMVFGKAVCPSFLEKTTITLLAKQSLNPNPCSASGKQYLKAMQHWILFLVLRKH
jgi:hypothetical protein